MHTAGESRRCVSGPGLPVGRCPLLVAPAGTGTVSGAVGVLGELWGPARGSCGELAEAFRRKAGGGHVWEAGWRVAFPFHKEHGLGRMGGGGAARGQGPRPLPRRQRRGRWRSFLGGPPLLGSWDLGLSHPTSIQAPAGGRGSLGLRVLCVMARLGPVALQFTQSPPLCQPRWPWDSGPHSFQCPWTGPG